MLAAGVQPATAVPLSQVCLCVPIKYVEVSVGCPMPHTVYFISLWTSLVRT